jgi:hypothetical protein
MKKYRYEVKYLNGKEQSFTCNSFNEAIIKAMAYAYEQAWDWRIESITDEKDLTITDIEINFSHRIV